MVATSNMPQRKRNQCRFPYQVDFPAEESYSTSSLHSNTFATPIAFTSGDAQAMIPLHCIDQAIYDIANEFRFTVQEVKEFYDKCGEMERTRTRFQRMRQLLNSVGDTIGDGTGGL